MLERNYSYGIWISKWQNWFEIHDFEEEIKYSNWFAESTFWKTSVWLAVNRAWWLDLCNAFVHAIDSEFIRNKKRAEIHSSNFNWANSWVRWNFDFVCGCAILEYFVCNLIYWTEFTKKRLVKWTHNRSSWLKFPSPGLSRRFIMSNS